MFFMILKGIFIRIVRNERSCVLIKEDSYLVVMVQSPLVAVC